MKCVLGYFDRFPNPLPGGGEPVQCPEGNMRMDRRVEIVFFFVILTVTAQDFDQGARWRELLLKEEGVGMTLPVRSRERYPGASGERYPGFLIE